MKYWEDKISNLVSSTWRISSVLTSLIGLSVYCCFLCVECSVTFNAFRQRLNKISKGLLVYRRYPCSWSKDSKYMRRVSSYVIVVGVPTNDCSSRQHPFQRPGASMCGLWKVGNVWRVWGSRTRWREACDRRAGDPTRLTEMCFVNCIWVKVLVLNVVAAPASLLFTKTGKTYSYTAYGTDIVTKVFSLTP